MSVDQTGDKHEEPPSHNVAAATESSQDIFEESAPRHVQMVTALPSPPQEPMDEPLPSPTRKDLDTKVINSPVRDTAKSGSLVSQAPPQAHPSPPSSPNKRKVSDVSPDAISPFKKNKFDETEVSFLAAQPGRPSSERPSMQKILDEIQEKEQWQQQPLATTLPSVNAGTVDVAVLASQTRTTHAEFKISPSSSTAVAAVEYN